MHFLEDLIGTEAYDIFFSEFLNYETISLKTCEFLGNVYLYVFTM